MCVYDSIVDIQRIPFALPLALFTSSSSIAALERVYSGLLGKSGDSSIYLNGQVWSGVLREMKDLYDLGMRTAPHHLDWVQNGMGILDLAAREEPFSIEIMVDPYGLKE